MVYGTGIIAKTAAFDNAKKYKELLFCYWWHLHCFFGRFCHGKVAAMSFSVRLKSIILIDPHFSWRVCQYLISQ